MSKRINGVILAIAYLRVSTKEQADKDLSIPAQRRAIKAWAKANGRKVIAWIEDPGVSAYVEPTKRKGFQELIARVRKGDVSEVLVHKSDRFSRDNETSVVVKAFLRRVGVSVVSITEPMDTSKPAGRLMEGLLDLMAQFYSDNLSQEVKKGLREKVEQGNYPGSIPPYGYDRIAKGKRRHVLKPNRETSKVIRRIYKLALRGDGPTIIAAELNAKGIPSPSGKAWGRASVAKVLKNPVYCGDTVWGSDSDRQTYADTHKPIVDRETFESAQSIRASRRKNPGRKPKGQTLLSGLIYGSCGHRYYTQIKGGTSYGYYICKLKNTQGVVACNGPNMPIRMTDDLVMTALLENAITPEQMAIIRKASVKALSTRDDSKALAAAESRIEEIEAERKQLALALAKGRLIDPILELDAQLEAERQELEDTIEGIRDASTSPAELAERWQDLEAFAASLRRNWHKMPTELKQRSINAFVDRVVVQPDKSLEIYFRYPGGGKLPPITTGGKRSQSRESGVTKASASPRLRTLFSNKKNSVTSRSDLGSWSFVTAAVRSYSRSNG